MSNRGDIMTSKELMALYNRLGDINERIAHIMKSINNRYIKTVLEEKQKEENNSKDK